MKQLLFFLLTSSCFLAFQSSLPFLIYRNGEARSGVPLGGLGTGYIEMLSSGAFGKSTIQNNFLYPSDLPTDCYLFLELNGKHIPLRYGDVDEVSLLGHFPIAELTYKDEDIPFPLSLKAFSPFVKGDIFNSSIPSLLFRFSLGRSSQQRKVKLGISWTNEEEKRGNLAGVLAWEKELLLPGEELFGICAIGLAEELKSLSLPTSSFATSCEREGKEIRDGGTKVEVGNWGAFNWEEKGQFTLTHRENGHLSAIFYSARWKNGSCGVYYAPKALLSENLQVLEEVRVSGDEKCARRRLRSEDGKVELTITDCLDEGILWREIRLKNISDLPLEDVSLSVFVNLDIGGLEGAENNIGFVKEEGKLLSICDREKKLCGFIKGIDNSHYFLGAWQEAHNRMRENRLLEVGKGKWQIERMTNGLLFRSEEGEYAIVFPEGRYKLGSRVEKERAIAWAEWDVPEEGEIWMALSWFFPHYVSTNGQELGHFYATNFSSAKEIGRYTLNKADEFLKEIEEWQGDICSLAIPSWLKDALINGLYPLVKNSLYTKDGKFSLSESFTGCPINETLVCRFNGSFPLLLFFPELEKSVMREFAKLQKEDGEIPFCFGMQDNFSSPVFHLQHPIVSTEFILMVWRDYLWTNDHAFLQEMYPSVRRAIRFARTLDKDGDSLIEEDPQPGGLANQYYDVWEWRGVSSYVNSILLAALKAVERTAEIMGDKETKEFAQQWFRMAQEEFQRRLWNGRWFNLYSNEENSPTCLANQLVGQWYAYLCRLGEILPQEKILSAVRWIGKLNCEASPYGVVNGVTPEGKPDETGQNHQSDGISPGEAFAFAATAIFAGERETGLAAGEKTYRNITLRRRSPWNIYFNYLSSTGEECWGSDYYSNMSIWSILSALKGDL